MAGSLARLQEAMRPYTRYTETQQASLVDTKESATREAHDGLAKLAAAIDAL